jgi:hypothetical protein
MRTIETEHLAAHAGRALARARAGAVHLAARPDGDDGFSLVSGLIVLDPEATEGTEIHRYPELILYRGGIAPAELETWLPASDGDRVVILAGVGRLHISGRWQYGSRLSAGERYVHARADWPSDVFRIELHYRGESDRRLRNMARLTGEGPLYPNAQAAIAHWVFGLEEPATSTEYDGVLNLVVPDRRARVAHVEVGGGELAFSVERGAAGRGVALELDAYVRTDAGVRQARVPVRRNRAAVPAVPPLRRLVAHLRTGPGDVIDEVEIGRPFRHDGDDPRVQPSAAQERLEVEAMIAGGEGPTVEFKRYLAIGAGRGDPSKEEFARTMVAFANRDGGVLLIGVEDDGTVREGYGPVSRGAVDNILAERCDPVPEYELRTVRLPKPVTLVRVRTDPNTIHTVGGCVYFRSGATDRRVGGGEITRVFGEALRPQHGPGMGF